MTRASSGSTPGGATGAARRARPTASESRSGPSDGCSRTGHTAGAPAGSIVWAAERLRPSDGLTVVLPCGLESFAGLRALLLAAAEAFGEPVDRLVAGHEESLGLAVPELVGAQPQQRGHFYNAENVGSSVIRRISRESIHLTDAIDDLARLLLDLLGRDDGRLVLLGAEHLDRPSARVLYRAYQLASPGATDWFWGFGAHVLREVGSGELTIERRFRDSRDRLFRVLAERLGVGAEESLTDLPGLAFEPDGAAEEIVTLVSQALVGQNYDRAYTAAAAGLGTLPAADRCNVWRMLCIADANMGRIDDAADSIDEAHRAAREDPWLASQCLYMDGLLETKRRYDLDAAERSYRRALALMDDCDRRDERTRVERAWATNGLALVRTLRTKQLDPDERDAELMRIFLDEAKAFQDVHDQFSAPALYLQLNLLANMALLLEVKGDFQRAASFWGRVFDKFRGTSSAERRSFEVSFLYRLALLELKAGAGDRARQAMDQALEVPDVASRSFTMERLLYGKGHVELADGAAAAAGDTFAAGCALALRLRHDAGLADHLTGLVEASREEPHPELERWTEAARLRRVSVRERRPLPAPKFPSYVPLVDLEVAPQIDLNRFLANDRSGQSLDQALRRTS